jgi:hypothetical protein
MKFLDQIKNNAVPATVMRSAAKGALPLPAAEMLEILVYLTQNPVFAQDARMALAGFDVIAAVEVLADPAAPPEVLGYFWLEENRRPALMPAMVENPVIDENVLMEAAATDRREIVTLLLASPRARSMPGVVEALATNPLLMPEELKELQEEPAPEVEAPAADDEEAEAAHESWRAEHAAEIAAEQERAFELTESSEEEKAELPPAPVSLAPSATLVTAALAAGTKAQRQPADGKKLSVLQKVARMNAAERVMAAFTGGRDERLILIRDGAKIVQNAVLASPKLTEPEVEVFASAKNLNENVLREISRSRRFMKNYNVVRNLVNNPKCPLDIALTLIKNLRVPDLKALRQNKGVAETIRQVAFKLYREKTGPAKEIKRKT